MQPDILLERLKELVILVKPIKNSPFPTVIKALTGYEVLHFDPNSEKNGRLIDLLSKAASEARDKANSETIVTRRANEAGNMIEPFLVDALRHVGLESGKPRCKGGMIKSAGYPDIETNDGLGTAVYIDCKTYAASNKNSTLRSFYLSPSEDPKITSDAFHFLVSFELRQIGKKGELNIYVPVSWELYPLGKSLDVKLKCEFHASNKDLYCDIKPLKEGKTT
ncbi:MAG: hypothetical protein ACXV5K_09720 [Halobacteriota archaeon]